MNEFQKEQWNALHLARQMLDRVGANATERLKKKISLYLEFRSQLDRFLKARFGAYCTQSCYANSRSACCSKDGIIVFWADVVINVLSSNEAQLADLEEALQRPFLERKCTYLGERGCLWQVKPLVCAMYLCDPVSNAVFQADNDIESEWKALKQRAQDFRWPDKPVLFDYLETYFMELGASSSLMHINQSPGLLRIKRQAGLACRPLRQKP